MKLISKIADIDGEIQELVHESKLPALNKLLDKSNDLYIERIAELEQGYEELRIAALNAVCEIGGGQAKADLRDAYDKATEQLEALKEGK
jgi:hypothetical protein